jgi:hypothetical protein|nr:MAG TPA: hypothetical protein [Bacteriophage sp.]
MEEVKSIQKQFKKKTKAVNPFKKQSAWNIPSDSQCEWMRREGKVFITFDRPFGGGEFEY